MAPCPALARGKDEDQSDESRFFGGQHLARLLHADLPLQPAHGVEVVRLSGAVGHLGLHAVGGPVASSTAALEVAATVRKCRVLESPSEGPGGDAALKPSARCDVR